MSYFKQVKLNELFEEIKCKKFTISKTTDGEIPLYGSSVKDECVKHVNEISYSSQDDDKLVRINKNGSVGYCFVCPNVFALTADVMLTRMKTNLTKQQLSLISVQLNNLFDWGNKLNIDRFNNTCVYLIE